MSLVLDLLIDISDVLQICSYELGRTYLKLSNVLCINIPSVGEYIFVGLQFFVDGFRAGCFFSLEMF